MTKLHEPSEPRGIKDTEEARRCYQECLDACDTIANSSWFYDKRTALAIADLIYDQFRLYYVYDYNKNQPIRNFGDQKIPWSL